MPQPLPGLTQCMVNHVFCREGLPLHVALVGSGHCFCCFPLGKWPWLVWLAPAGPSSLACTKWTRRSAEMWAPAHAAVC